MDEDYWINIYLKKLYEKQMEEDFKNLFGKSLGDKYYRNLIIYKIQKQNEMAVIVNTACS